jgi:hypothetical protein
LPVAVFREFPETSGVGTMNYARSFTPFATLLIAATLSLGGCKSNNPPAQNAQSADNSQPSAQQPAPQQPADQPSPAQQASAAQPQAMQPAAPVAQPVAPAAAPAPPPPPPPPPKPIVYTLPAGTAISVHTDSDLSSKTSKPNEGFTATVAESVRVNGNIVIPRGARAQGVVVDAKNQGKVKGEGFLSIRLTNVHTKWGSYQISTATIDNTQKGKGKRTAVTTGGGAGLGAIIGGIAGGGKGAAIGALAGGGAGFAGGVFTGNKEIKIPAESLLSFQLTEPIAVHVSKQAADEDQPALQQPPAEQPQQ